MKYPGTDVDIRDVQLIQLEILKEFDRIAKKHNIPYQLFAGTLLGAVRHKGFIPWDDDIDVCLLRKDYDRFLEVCASELSEQYFLQNKKTDLHSVFQFSKLKKNNTVFENKLDCNPKTHNGIYIDIFPLDNVKPDTFLGKLQPMLFNILYAINTSREYHSINTARNHFVRFLRIICYIMVKIIPKSILDSITEKVLCQFNDQPTTYVNHLTNRATRKRLAKYIRERDTFYDMIEVEFEGALFPAPANYHEVLKRNFGDYMQLPPDDKQKPHHGIIRVKL